MEARGSIVCSEENGSRKPRVGGEGRGVGVRVGASPKPFPACYQQWPIPLNGCEVVSPHMLVRVLLFSAPSRHLSSQPQGASAGGGAGRHEGQGRADGCSGHHLIILGQVQLPWLGLHFSLFLVVGVSL